jgi:hypothetical protein
MSNHTKEPWIVYDDTNDGKTNRIEIVAIGKTVARIYQSDKSEDLPNALRIVGCVNACSGMDAPVAEIESLRTQLAEATRKLEEARKDAPRNHPSGRFTFREYNESIVDGLSGKAWFSLDAAIDYARDLEATALQAVEQGKGGDDGTPS